MQYNLTSSQGISGDAVPLMLARGLGAFSIALGLGELLAPRRLNDALGTDAPNLTRAYGAREIVTGVGLLVSKNPTPWLWARVAGDVLDIATLAAAGRREDSRKIGVGTAIGLVAGVTALDILSARMMQHRGKSGAKGWLRVRPDRSRGVRQSQDGLSSGIDEEELGGPDGMLHKQPDEELRLQTTT